MVTFSEPSEAGLESLTEAIIMQACTDYLYVLIHGWAPHANEHKVNTVELEQFFRSEWCNRLIPGDELDGEDIITEMRSAAQRIRAMRYKVRKSGKRQWEVYDVRDPELDLGKRYSQKEYARRDAAKLDNLTPWQYCIAVAKLTREPTRKRRQNPCANGNAK